MFARRAILTVGLAFSLSAGTAFACDDRQAAIDAIEAEDFSAAQSIQERVSIDPACDDAFRIWLDEAVARDVFRQARAAKDPKQARALYETSLSYSPHWRSYDALGQLSGQSGDRAGEAIFLQQAINQIQDGPTHHAASEEEIKDLFTRASSAMLLAKNAVKLPRTRSGGIGGIFISNLRGYAVEEVPLAVEFEFDSVNFTNKGRNYADQLLEHLKFNEISAISLEGHTDPVGPHSYNLALSKRRAEALKIYLAQNGFEGDVNTFAKGETEIPDAQIHNVEADSPEHHQIARRVMLIWS